MAGTDLMRVLCNVESCAIFSVDEADPILCCILRAVGGDATFVVLIHSCEQLEWFLNDYDDVLMPRVEEELRLKLTTLRQFPAQVQDLTLEIISGQAADIIRMLWDRISERGGKLLRKTRPRSGGDDPAS